MSVLSVVLPAYNEELMIAKNLLRTWRGADRCRDFL